MLFRANLLTTVLWKQLQYGSEVWTMMDEPNKMPAWIGQLLCRLSLHDYRLIEEVVGFGAGGSVQKLACRRCGKTTTRRA